jgi:opacity protein-like surface antigen
MKTNLQAQILGLLLLSAGVVNAQPQTAPPPSAPGGPPPSTQGPMPSTQAPTYGPMPATDTQGPSSGPPGSAPGPMPATPSAGPQYYEPAPPADYADAARSSAGTYQGRFMVGIGWDVGMPIGSAHDFTQNLSPAGFALSFQYFATSNLSVGASMDWQTYWDSRPRTTNQISNGAITATADNSIQNGAARAMARWYFIDHGPILPYAGFNIGVGWSTFQSTAATLVLYDNTVSVLVGGELGAAFAPSRTSPLLTLSARYTTLPAADFLTVTDVQSITFQLGMMSP